MKPLPPTDSITAAAVEYRAARAGQKQPAKPPSSPIDQDARDAFVFDCLWDAIRHAVAAQVAIGAGDQEMAHGCLAALVEDVKTAARAWNAGASGRKAA